MGAGTPRGIAGYPTGYGIYPPGYGYPLGYIRYGVWYIPGGVSGDTGWGMGAGGSGVCTREAVSGVFVGGILLFIAFSFGGSRLYLSPINGIGGTY